MDIIKQKILNIILQKKSNLILSIDLVDKNEIIRIINLVHHKLLGIKLHSDIIIDFDELFYLKIKNLSQKYNFIIIDDRKLCDIGDIVLKQSKNIIKYADLITCHAISGDGLCEALSELSISYEFRILLIAQMSSQNNLIDENYTQNVIKMANKYKNIVTGFICQEYLCNDFIHFTPGVSIDNKNDKYQQGYTSPDYLINTKQIDVLIVGRSIISQLIMIKSNSCYKDLIDQIFNQYIHINYNNLLNLYKNECKQKMLNYGVVQYGKFILSSGIESDIYYNMKLLVSNPILMDLIIDLLYIKIIQIIQEYNTTTRRTNLDLNEVSSDIILAGVPIGAIPIVSALSNKYKIPMILIRQDIKNHGTKNMIEGKYENQKCIMIEDVITTGSSVCSIIKMTEKIDYIGIITVLNRGNIKYLNRTNSDLSNQTNVYSIFDDTEFNQISSNL